MQVVDTPVGGRLSATHTHTVTGRPHTRPAARPRAGPTGTSFDDDADDDSEVVSSMARVRWNLYVEAELDEAVRAVAKQRKQDHTSTVKQLVRVALGKSVTGPLDTLAADLGGLSDPVGRDAPQLGQREEVRDADWFDKRQRGRDRLDRVNEACQVVLDALHHRPQPPSPAEKEELMGLYYKLGAASRQVSRETGVR